MAQKRRIGVERSGGSEEIEDVPERFKESTWSEWARHSYAKWWYGILCMFVDLLLALEISSQLTEPWNYFIPTLVIVPLLVFELYVYHRLWGGLDILFGGRRFL